MKVITTTNFRNETTEQRISSEVEAIKGPGTFLAFGEVKRRANKYVQLELTQEAVIVGIIITTYKNHTLKKFRVRANNDLNNPSLLTMSDPISRAVSYFCFDLIPFH